MYGKKAIYFNYKSYGGFIMFLLVPACIILISGSIAYSFLAWQPILIGIAAAALLASPGYPRYMAINANVDLKSDKYKKALKRVRIAVRLPFTPVSVRIFHAYVEIQNGYTNKADEILEQIKKEKISYSEQAKWDAVKALVIWKKSMSPEEGLKYLEDKDRKGVDEAILYVKGKLLNMLPDKSDSRKYNEIAYERNQGNRDLLSNLVISYCRTTQERDAKILFRTLYQDLIATSDSLFFMAGIKEKENKKEDAVDFIKAALETEESFLSIVSHSQLEEHLEKLKNELSRGVL